MKLTKSGIALILAAVATSPPASWAAAGDAFDLGIAQVESVRPTAGYFVPPRVLRESYAVSPDSVIAAGRAMTTDELRRFVHGDAEATVTSEHALFVYPNVGACMFRWRGELDCAQQRVIVRVWDDTTWQPYLEPTEATVQLATFVAPPEAESVFVLVQQHNGTRDHDRLRTERVEFARHPGWRALIDAGLERADVVVHIPVRSQRTLELPLVLDCLKGWIEPAAFRTAVAHSAPVGSGPALVFLRTDGAEGAAAEVLAVHDIARASFSGPHGTVLDPKFDRTSSERHDLRFALARRRTPAADARSSTLALERAGDLLVVELAMGRTEPLPLFVPSITRSGRDGGEPLFGFEVRRDDTLVALEPEGRFGADSWQRRDLATCAELGFDYAFVHCGQGVVKLVLRPHASPFRAEVRAVVVPLADSFARPGDADPEETTPFVGMHFE